MFVDTPEKTLVIPSLWRDGAAETGAAQVHADGIIIETNMGNGFGIEWDQLLDIIGDPNVQERLSEAARARGE
jgi:hypothetical protein